MRITRGGLLKSSDAAGAYAPRGMPAYANAQMVLIFDDVKISHYTIALPAVEAVNGKMTLAVNSGAIDGDPSHMTSAQILDAYNRGHEIAAHSVTHTDMTTLTATTRQPEWDNSKSTIEAIIGAGKCRTWVYPGNAHNAATDSEAYLRYDRVFIGPTQGAPTSRLLGDRTGFVDGRFGWSDTNHAQILALIDHLAHQSVVFAIYTHAVDGSQPGNGVTQAQLTELLAKVAGYGIPIVTAAQGYPAGLSVPDAGFEDPVLTMWTVTTSGAGTVTSVADTPMTGYNGSRSLQIVGDGSGTNRAASTLLPVRHPQEPYTLSYRSRANNVTVGNAFIQVVEYDANGATVATTNAPATGGTAAWAQKTLPFTPNVLTRTLQLNVQGSGTLTGTVWFDHIHLGPTRHGVHG